MILRANIVACEAQLPSTGMGQVIRQGQQKTQQTCNEYLVQLGEVDM